MSQHRSKNSNVQREPTGRRNHTVGRNPKEQHERIGSSKVIGKRGQV